MENAGRYEEQRRTVERLEETERLKADFITSVSHELRTPLTSILGNAVTLERAWSEIDDATRLDLLASLTGRARELEEKSQAEAYAERLSQADIAIGRRVGENDTLYGSVTSADVAQALHAKGFDIDKKKITMADPFKALGEYTVPVKVHREVTAQIKVKVVAEQKK